MNLQEEFSKMKKATLFAAATALLGAQSGYQVQLSLRKQTLFLLQ